MVLFVARGANSLSDKEIVAARKIYVAKCAKCHQFYEPRDYSVQDWEKWMAKMTRKSKLKDDQAQLLKRYLNAYRSGEFSGKPEDKSAARPKVSAKP